MNALKSIVMLAFLAGVGYVVYLSVTKNPRKAHEPLAAVWPTQQRSQLLAPGELMPHTRDRAADASAGVEARSELPTLPPATEAPPMGIPGRQPSTPNETSSLPANRSTQQSATPDAYSLSEPTVRSLPPPPVSGGSSPAAYGARPELSSPGSEGYVPPSLPESVGATAASRAYDSGRLVSDPSRPASGACDSMNTLVGLNQNIGPSNPQESAAPTAAAEGASIPRELGVAPSGHRLANSASAAASDPFRGDVGTGQFSAGLPAHSVAPNAEGNLATTAPSDRLAAPDPALLEQFRAIMETIYARLDEGKLVEGLQTLTQLYEMPSLPETLRNQVIELAGQVAGTVIYSKVSYLQPPHVVQPGESLEMIAAKYQLTPELILRINGLTDASAIRPGDALKVLPGPFSAVVSLDRRELALFVRGLYAGRFPIGLGRDRTKLEGVYGVRDKVRMPGYVGPDQISIPGGDPRNPLGRAALDLGGGVALHGCESPSALGRDDNRGTICLGDRDLDDLYDILTIGSRVTIQR